MAVAEKSGPGRAKVLALRFGLLAIVIVAWQFVGDDTVRINMPTFTRTATSFGKMIISGELPRALVDSNVALVLGYLLALSIAVPVGVAMGLIRSVKALVNPYLIILLSTPLIAVLPISALALLGVGGLLYTGGVAFHLWKSLPYQNAVWHGFVLAAAGCHYVAVLEALAGW